MKPTESWKLVINADTGDYDETSTAGLVKFLWHVFRKELT